jgi:hypothetical protein
MTNMVAFVTAILVRGFTVWKVCLYSWREPRLLGIRIRIQSCLSLEILVLDGMLRGGDSFWSLSVLSQLCTCSRLHQILAYSLNVCSLASLLPPNMTLRLYQRHILSTTASEIGTIYCAIVSYAAENDQDKKASNVQPVVSSLVATRSRLNRSELLWTNIIYEVCPLCYIIGSRDIRLSSSRCGVDGRSIGTNASWTYNCACIGSAS